ncbi:MAG: TonB-dependent receptor [Alphaproteobacteria bacterium]
MRQSAPVRYSAGAFVPALLASTALAGAPFGARAASATTPVLKEIVVTAQRTPQDLQKVPMNITALSSEQLSQLGLKNFNDFELFMPSVTYAVSGQGSNGGPGFANITMRGVASDQNGNHSGPLPTVGVYLDEQPITTIGGTLDIPAYDIQRVEALSGPQGTLYGASSESGTIRILTNKPDRSGFAAAYGVEVTTVTHGGTGYGGHGMINSPFGNNAAIRLVVWDEHNAGYIDNVHVTRTYPTSGIVIDNASAAKNNYNTLNKYGGRAALQIDLDDNWTATPSIMGQSTKSNGIFGYDSTLLDPTSAATTFTTVSRTGELEVGHFLPEFVRDRWYQAGLTVQGKVGNLDLVYAGAYMNRVIHSQADYSDYAYWYDTLYGSGAFFYDNLLNLVDPTQYIIGRDLFTKHSQEVRLVTPSDWRFRYTAGLFYERQSHHILQDYKVVGDIADSISVTGWPDTIWLTNQLRVDRDYAIYFEASYDLTPSLILTGGIRGFYADNSLRGFFGFSAGFSLNTGENKCFLLAPSEPGGPCTNLDARVHESGETHKLNLTWQVSDNKLLYVTYSTGFRPGGVNRRTDIPGVGPYSSDTLDNYEFGWKTSSADGKVRFNGDFFYEKWNKFQFPFLGPSSVTIIKNVGQATIKGAEANIDWLPAEGLTLSGSAAWTEARLSTDYCGGDCASNPVQAPTGTQLPITPRWKANAVARYEFDWAGLDAHIQGAAVYQSGHWSDLRLYERSLLGRNRPFTLVNFSTGIGRENWMLELAVKNAFDQLAQLGRYPECTPGTCGFETYILPTQPRTISLSWSQKI